MEQWKAVEGYEGIYEVSNTGQVRTCENKITSNKMYDKRVWKQRILKQKVTKDNTCRVNLWKDGKEKTWLVHRIVALAFLEPIPGKEYVNHIDGSRLNNAVSNLEWCNHTENNNHAFDNRLIKTGKEIKIFDAETGITHIFRSMAKASKFMGKGNGFVSNLLKDGEKEYKNFIIMEG